MRFYVRLIWNSCCYTKNFKIIQYFEKFYDAVDKILRSFIRKIWVKNLSYDLRFFFIRGSKIFLYSFVKLHTWENSRWQDSNYKYIIFHVFSLLKFKNQVFGSDFIWLTKDSDELICEFCPRIFYIRIFLLIWILIGIFMNRFLFHFFLLRHFDIPNIDKELSDVFFKVPMINMCHEFLRFLI